MTYEKRTFKIPVGLPKRKWYQFWKKKKDIKESKETIKKLIDDYKEDIAWVEKKIKEKFILKTKSSINAIKSEEQFHSIAKAAFKDLLKITDSGFKNKNNYNIYEIGQMVDTLRIKRKKEKTFEGHLRGIADLIR